MNLKKVIIILIIILIILIAIAIMVIKNKNNEYKPDPPIENTEIEIENTIKKVSNRNNYYIVEKCTNKFFNYYQTVFNIEEAYNLTGEQTQDTINEIQQQNIEILYNVLDQEYITSRNITKDNILTKLKEIELSVVNIDNMYVCEKTSNISLYIVEGTLTQNNTNKIQEFKIIVKLDSANRTFSVISQDYIDENYKNLNIGNEIDIEVEENIPENKNNVYTFRNISDETYVKDIFNKFKALDLQEFYNNLDEEYRNKKFGTFENFKEYMIKNDERYSTMEIDKYQKTVTNNYTQYVCIDRKGNYYIFNENAIMDFDIILDTYTVDLPQFIDKYNVASEQQKVAYNIDRFIQAINDKSYYYAYNCLADSYKNNYFKTQQEFENYAKENFYANNTVEYKEFNMEGELYTYSVILTDKETAEQMNKTFIMQLGESTDFVLSFNR